jgi:hypothetical protein
LAKFTLRVFQKYLSSPGASVICFIIALLAKISLFRIFLDIGPDKLGQVLIARNFLKGHGISVDEVAITNLAEKIYTPVIGWAPGYSFMISPFLTIWKDNYMLACFAVDCVTALIFFWYLRKLLLLINFPSWIINLFLIFQGFFISYYVAGSSASDFPAMTFLLAALYYLIRITRRSSISYRLTISLSIFLLAACLMRYQYFPAGILLVLTLTASGFAQKEKHWWKSGLISLCIIGIIGTAGMLYQQLNAGSSTFLRPAAKGFYPENMKLLYPFIISSVTNLHFYAVQLSEYFHKPYPWWIEVAKLFNWIILVLLAAVFIRCLVRKKLSVQNTTESFSLFGGIMAIGVSGLLIMISLFVSADVGPPSFSWTYVMEDRYFAFPALFIQVWVWQWLFVQPAVNRSIFKKILQWFFVLIISIEIFHGLYFILKKMSQPMLGFDQIVASDPEKEIPIEFIRAQQKKNPGIKTVVTSFRKLPGYVANWYGGSGLFTPGELNVTVPASAEPAVLLVVIPKKDVILLASFLQRPGVELLQESGDFSFYTYYVGPTSGNNR